MRAPRVATMTAMVIELCRFPLSPTSVDGQAGVWRMSDPCVAMNPTTPWERTHPSTPAAVATEYARPGHAARPAAMMPPGRCRRAGKDFTPLGYAEKPGHGWLGQRGPRDSAVG